MLRIAILILVSLALPACSTPSAAPTRHDTAEPTAAPADPRVMVIGALGGVVNAGWVADWSGVAGASRGCMRSYAAGRYALEMPLEEGDRFLSMLVAASGTFSADLEVWMNSAAPTGPQPPAVSVLVAPNIPGPTATDIMVDLPDTLVTAGAAHWFEFTADQGGLCVGAVRLTYDHPGR
jgi:hypothetical protein